VQVETENASQNALIIYTLKPLSDILSNIMKFRFQSARQLYIFDICLNFDDKYISMTIYKH
jgi:hypothetical protein